MPMLHNGLAKLVEESGELQQVAGKMLQYPHLQLPAHSAPTLKHPDGTNLRTRFEEEAADTIAAIYFTLFKLGLSFREVSERTNEKLKLFKQWDNEV